MTAPATVAVLTYHSIATDSTSTLPRLTVDPALFAEHVAALHECGLLLIPFGEVPARLAEGRDAVAITIDDGFVDAGENACPILISHGVPATLFVPSGYLGGVSGWLPHVDDRRPVLSGLDVAELSRNGFEIGSHGRMHIAADINDPQMVLDDARASREALEDCIGAAVDSFAYPFGFHSPSGRRAVRLAGYRQACAVGNLHAQLRDDPFAIPRLQVEAGTSAEQLVELVRRRHSAVARGAIRAKQIVWRSGRRWLAWGPPESGRRTVAGGPSR